MSELEKLLHVKELYRLLEQPYKGWLSTRLDKVLHFLGSGLITILLIGSHKPVWQARERLAACIFAFVFIVAASYLLEFLQSQGHRGRQFSHLDVLSAAAGSVLVLLLYALLVKVFVPKGVRAPDLTATPNNESKSSVQDTK